jgi:hypothetical protein
MRSAIYMAKGVSFLFSSFHVYSNQCWELRWWVIKYFFQSSKYILFYDCLCIEGPCMTVDNDIHCSLVYRVASCTVRCDHNKIISVCFTKYKFDTFSPYIFQKQQNYVTTLCFVNHLLENAHCGVERETGIWYIYENITFLLLCSFWKKCNELLYCT